MAGAAVLVIILVLIGTGVLVIPPSGPPAKVNVQEVCVNWIQSRNASGYLWFGQNNYCLTGIPNGLPYSAAPGSSVNLPIPVLNYDTSAHTLYYVQVLSPLTLERTLPALPYVVQPYTTNPEGIDGGLMIYVVLPNSPGATVTANVTISALPGG